MFYNRCFTALAQTAKKINKPESIMMKNFLTTATIAILLAVVTPASDSEGQVDMRMILEQIMRNQKQNQNGNPNWNQNENQNRGNPQFPQRPIDRHFPTPNPTARQNPRGLPPHAIPGQQQNVQSYVLTTAGVESKATFDGNKLMIYSDGVGYRYSRLPRFDTADGKYLGFSNQTLDKRIRFPIHGNTRMQEEGPNNVWYWSQTKVRKSAAPVAVGDIYAQVDGLALQIQSQARQLASEANTYCRSSPHYAKLIVDTSAMLKQSMHMHEICDGRGDINLFAEDLAALDESFHRVERAFARIEADGRQGHGPRRRYIVNVDQILRATNNNINVLQGIVAKVNRPTIQGPPFGTCSNIDPLVHRLQDAVNDLLLDMHYNYCENPKFDSAYRRAYRLLAAAEDVHEAGEKNQRGRMRRSLKGLDGLTCQLQDEFRTWTCQAQYRCGIGTLRQKLSNVQWILLDLMHDAGVEPTELRYLVGRNLVAPPSTVPPRPR